jgi:hypothetical protein
LGCQPLLRSVTESTPDRSARIFVEGDVLSGGAVVPGFDLPVAEIFAWPSIAGGAAWT